MPKIRKLTGIAALSAVSLATVVISAPVAAVGEEVCLLCPGEAAPGQLNKLLKYEGRQAFDTISGIFVKYREVGPPGLEAFLQKFDKT